MKIAVFADTHGNKNYFKQAAYLMKGCDKIIFLGDGIDDIEYFKGYMDLPVMCVRGNNDYGSDAPLSMTLKEAGTSLFCTHGHKHYVKTDLLRLYLAGAEAGANAVLFAHTHRPLIINENGILLINPGSLGDPRGLVRPSFVILDVNDGLCSPQLVEVK